jgi:4-hydroxy-tetrahydrodipicolinate synthase
MFEAIKQQLKGINAINITPFGENGDIDYEALGRNLDFLIERGIKAIYPCGNTGEYYSLSIQEAKAVAEFAVRHIGGRALVMVGIGHDVRTASELAAHAEQIGADGLMIHQPVHPFQLESGILDYYRQVAESTKLPIIVYVRNESMTAETLKEAAKVTNIIGVKYAVNHLPSFMKAVRLIGDELVWICGTAEMWAPFFYAAGAVGFTSGMVNVDTKRSFAMLEALRNNQMEAARQVWEEIRPFEELREQKRSGNNVSVVKEAMAQLGLASSRVRPPIAPLTQEEKGQVTRILQSWGLL